jgi:hypothetical protein
LERKSIEPMALALPDGNVQAMHSSSAQAPGTTSPSSNTTSAWLPRPWATAPVAR